MIEGTMKRVLLAAMVSTICTAQQPSPPAAAAAAGTQDNGGSTPNPNPNGGNDSASAASTPLPPGVDFVLGIGSLVSSKHTDYTVNSTTNVIQGKQIGRASPQYLAGIGYQLPFRGLYHKTADTDPNHPWKSQPWGAFISFKFSEGSSTTLSGYVFGLSYKIHSSLSLLAGYALTGYNDPSPGFQTAAVLAVANNPKLYPGFNAPSMNNNRPGAFDGFPLLRQAGDPATNLYPGDPLETHYRGGFVIGVSITKSIASLFSSGQKDTTSTQTGTTAPPNKDIAPTKSNTTPAKTDTSGK